jgi:hypothetical protein
MVAVKRFHREVLANDTLLALISNEIAIAGKLGHR